ncbi:insulinase family protein, partial [bacterium]|nr:insulinase family protein [bacterium]MBU1025775.1 insulinase family protein [bacterium]
LTIPETVIEKERSVVTKEIHQRGDIPDVRIWELFYATALKVHSYHNPVIGYEETIEGIESDTFRVYYREHYTPDQFVIAISGDFDSETVMSRLAGAFSAYSSTGKDFERGIQDPPQIKIHSATDKADVNSMHFMMGWRIPPAKEPTSPGLEILAEVLGGGDDSRLYKALKTSGIVDEISCFTDFNHDESFFIVYALAPEDNLEDIKGISLKIISGIIENPPTDEEFKRAKQRIGNNHAFSLQTYWELSQHLARWEILGNLEQGISWIDLINASEKDEIPDLYSKYIKLDNYTWVALLPDHKTYPKIADAPFESKTPVKDVLPGDVISTQFNNGAKLIFKYDTASDIVGISVLAGLGQVMEIPENRGIGEFTARMLLKGCADLDSTEFRKKTEELGLRITSSGARDFLNLSFEIRKDRLRDGLEILSKVLFNPTFDESEMKLVRDEITSEIKRRKDSPFNLVNDEFFSMIYGETPYGLPVEGTEETIAQISRDDLINFHSLAFTPKNLTISIVGDLEYSSWQPTFNKFLGRLFHSVRTDETMNFDYPIDKISPTMYQSKTLDLPRAQISFNMGSIALAADNPDYPALKMLVRILGLRLFDKYVYELGWSYRMWFYMPTWRGPSPLMFEMGVAQDKFSEAKSGLIDAMKEITAETVSDEEFGNSLNYILQSFHLGMQKNIDMAYNL